MIGVDRVTFAILAAVAIVMVSGGAWLVVSGFAKRFGLLK